MRWTFKDRRFVVLICTYFRRMWCLTEKFYISRWSSLNIIFLLFLFLFPINYFTDVWLDKWPRAISCDSGSISRDTIWPRSIDIKFWWGWKIFVRALGGSLKLLWFESQTPDHVIDHADFLDSSQISAIKTLFEKLLSQLTVWLNANGN